MGNTGVLQGVKPAY